MLRCDGHITAATCGETGPPSGLASVVWSRRVRQGSRQPTAVARVSSRRSGSSRPRPLAVACWHDAFVARGLKRVSKRLRPSAARTGGGWAHSPARVAGGGSFPRDVAAGGWLVPIARTVQASQPHPRATCVVPSRRRLPLAVAAYDSAGVAAHERGSDGVGRERLSAARP